MTKAAKLDFARAIKGVQAARISTMAQLRDAVIRRVIADEVSFFMKGRKTRRCAWCGLSFHPRQRYHFLAHEECRRQWYAGQFVPRKKHAHR